jgi:hypothetical protein
MAVKKCVVLRLGVICDSQVINRKQGGPLREPPNPSGALLLVEWESYMTPSRPEYTKKHQKQVDGLPF